MAGGADHVVVFLGLPASFESEGFDRCHMDLPANQLALLAAVAGVHDDVVVVLSNGSVVGMSGWQQQASAILEMWLGGQAAGGAVSDLLLGRANPSGRLAETVPLRLEDNPSYLNFPGEEGHVRYGEGVFAGYRHYDAVAAAVGYPFGHGLSYTTFDYSDLELAVSGSAERDDLRAAVALTVTNTGDRAGHEVVQVYVGDPVASVRRPQRELKAFAKVAIDPGERRRVQLSLDGRDFSFWSASARRWRVEGGRFDIAVGASSRDIRLTASVDLAGDGFRPPLEATSTLQEWLDDPDGGDVLRESFSAGDGGLGALIRDDSVARMLGQFTLRTIASFGVAPPGERVAELVAEVAQRRAAPGS